ncbi:MAG: PHP domain-containing protein [Sandaracinaceae bacterium]|nr:PHP domain-containing protein [Sandaracinaceae bacterium]
MRELGVLVAGEDVDGGVGHAAAARPPEASIAVHVAPLEAFGARALWLTASEAHLAALAARARERGLTLDEGGLRDASGALVSCAEEDDVYRALELHPTAPERREPGVPLVEVGKARPRLVTRADLRGALHNHTVASDGTATLEAMREAAAARELAYLGISEHSHSAFYARGLDGERLVAQAREIAALNERPGSCVVLSGVESDILKEGELDYGADVLSEVEVVVASVHRRHAQTPEQMTARMVAAAKNPFTDVVGHPTGRLLLGRAPSEYDVAAFLDACAASGCAVELNANPHRLDLNEGHLTMAKERGVLVSIAADAHSVDELDNLEHGVTIARRAGLTPDDVLNARPLEALRAWLAARRERAAKESGALAR